MGAILITWLVIAAAFTGIGFGVARLWSFQQEQGRCIIPCFWLGFAITLLGLQIWHFVFPVDIVPAFIVIAAGGAGLYVSRGNLFSSVRSCGKRTILMAIVIAVWVSNRSVGPATAFDTGYYNYPAVKWFTTYPIVPGLGNLHDRLGFN